MQNSCLFKSISEPRQLYTFDLINKKFEAPINAQIVIDENTMLGQGSVISNPRLE